MQDLVEDLLDALGLGRPRPGDQLEQQDAEGVNIDLRRGGHATDLLGRHVIRRSQREPGPRERRVLALGDAEIHQLHHSAGGDLDVLRLDVPVHDLLRVYVLERAGDLQRQAQLAVQIAGPVGLDQAAQVLAPQVFHDHERPALVFAELVDPDDVVVADIAGHPRLLQEARFGFRILAGLLGEDLHRHGAADHRIPRPVDARHAAA